MPHPIRNRQKPFWHQVRKPVLPSSRPAGRRPGKKAPFRPGKP
jgi:hypothetical protein